MEKRKVGFYMSQIVFHAITKEGYFVNAFFSEEEGKYTPCVLLITKSLWDKLFKEFTQKSIDFYKVQGFFTLKGQIEIESLEYSKINLDSEGKFIKVFKATSDYWWLPTITEDLQVIF